MIALKDFIVLKSLKVTDIEVKPKQISAAYIVEHFNGEIQQTRLIYSYQQPVFDNKNLADKNLASMMVAQVAINYGLFCEELIFDGWFEKTDKEFINYMIENTSREILTNKLLVPNVFLINPFDNLVAKKQNQYTQAQVVFLKQENDAQVKTGFSEAKDSDKYAILSSGGKDSLLSYGLIKEFGQPYPVFVNESGRHWFTAVNAFRHFQNHEPNTSKIWCNSDRVFNFMLKQLKFIRKDYANVRADIYPVRLWTVAVFLFGVLPIALKNGIGNIVIGDEYDTSEKGNLEGISHYNGLYDQSKYFDNALTRYYHKKGWKIFQFSMLRSMSEILIMKVLLKRYPELQKLQMSCHAAHEKENKMYPCGNCEKCRRIIGMIIGLGEDPSNCGYTSTQIDRSLNDLSIKKVKQIGTDAAQLYHLLLTKGYFTDNETFRKAAKEHPQVMKLRFDQERSNLEDMPEYVRRPLFEILQQYANGAVERKSQQWQTVNFNQEFLNLKPYKFYATEDKE